MARTLTAICRTTMKPFPLCRSPLQLYTARTLWTVKQLAYINYVSTNCLLGLEGCLRYTDVENEVIVIKLQASLQ